MRIALINGSPKSGSSTSRALLTELKSYLCGRAEVTQVELNKTSVSKEVLDELEQADVWVFACPLYVDGISAHLLSCLIELEEAHWPKGEILIYGIVNCGFYEGIQAEFALEILENWCAKIGFHWAGGVKW